MWWTKSGKLNSAFMFPVTDQSTNNKIRQGDHLKPASPYKIKVMKRKEVKKFLKSIENYSSESRLFRMLEEIGETLDGDVHIVQTSGDDIRHDDDIVYRVYIKTGYCFDAMKVLNDYSEDDNPVYEYQFYSEWDGFDGIRANDACHIIEKFMLSIK
jgi:putative component of toxin-antitoxin plasmid stabilization module